PAPPARPPGRVEDAVDLAQVADDVLERTRDGPYPGVGPHVVGWLDQIDQGQLAHRGGRGPAERDPSVEQPSRQQRAEEAGASGDDDVRADGSTFPSH